MYYWLVLALAMAVCAHAEVPDYLGAYSNANKSSGLLLTHLSFSDGSLSNRITNYMILKTAVSGLADAELLLNLKYEKIYEFGTLLAEVVGKSSPGIVRDLSRKRYALAKEKTALIRKLVEENCLPNRVPSLSAKIDGNPVKCNEVVDELVKKDPQLQKEAKLLLALGDLGYQYLTLEPELLDAANNDKEAEYLRNGKEKLRAIVDQALKTYKLLYF